MHINFHMNVGQTPTYGYTKMEIAIWRELLALGVEVTPSGRYSARVHRVLPENVLESLRTPSRVLGDITLATRQVRQIKDWHLHNTRIWLFTMAESNKVRPGHVADINGRCERIIVPCPDLVDVYRDSGVTVPIHFIPLGVDYQPVEWVDRKPNEAFRWLGYSLGGTRKGAMFTVMAHAKAFGNKPLVKLWIKTSGDRSSWLQGCLEDNIITLPGMVSESAWYELLSDVHAFAFPSMAEGSGLPPREAVLNGLPTIATPWLGMWDVAEWGFPVKIKGLRNVLFSVETVNADDAQWAEPDWNDLADQMAWITEHYDQAVEKTRAGREYLLQNFTWRQTAQKIVELLEQHG